MRTEPAGKVVAKHLPKLGGRLLPSDLHSTLKEFRPHGIACDLGGIVALEAELFHIAVALGIGQLRYALAALLDEFVRQIEGSEVRVGEQAIVVGRLLHAHDDRMPSTRLPVARLLVDDAPLLKDLRLAKDLVLEAIVQALEGVDVLELRLGSKPRLSAASQAYIAVAAHGPRLHGAIGYAEREKRLAKLLHEQARFFGCTQVRLGDELNQRRAAAVVVNQRLRRLSDAAFFAADVHHLGRILLHVDAQNPYGGHVGAVRRAPSYGRLSVRSQVLPAWTLSGACT